MFGSTLNKYSRRDLSIVRRLPQWVLRFYARYVFLPTIGLKHVEASYCKLSPSDIRHLQNPIALESLVRDNIESAKQKYFGFGDDLYLMSHNWGFEITDVPKVYHGLLHIWNGDEDVLVPLGLQECIKKLIPELVQLHPVVGEGHLSAFCFNEKIHRETLTTLFGVYGVTTKGVDCDEVVRNTRLPNLVGTKGVELPTLQQEKTRFSQTLDFQWSSL